jgi:mannosyltransferase OCH1-like enzyme
MINPIYGAIAAVILILLDSIQNGDGDGLNKKEGFESAEIPKVIYQTWSSKDLPPKMAECVNRLKNANPDFTYELFDDADCREFIATEFDPDVLDAYNNLIPGAFKADLWRYCVLYKRGGFYVDIKFQCEPGFSFNTKTPNFYVREYNHKGTGLYDHIVYTGVIGSRPNNPLFMECIKQIVENVKKKYYGPEHTSATGPWLFASKMDPDDFENIEYSYYESDGIGYIRHIENETVIMSHYPEYRVEQKSYGSSSYWKDAWIKREVYSTK